MVAQHDQRKQQQQLNMLPHNEEFERRILAGVLLDPEFAYQKVSHLSPEDFYLHPHRMLFEAMQSLANQEFPLEFMAIKDKITSTHEVSDREIGYIQELYSESQTPYALGNIDQYIPVIEKLSGCRRILKEVTTIAGAAYEEEYDTARERLEGLTYTLQTGTTNTNPSPIRGLFASFLERLDFLSTHKREVTGVHTGFTDLDRLTCGLQKDDLLILAARPSVGKTSFALSLAHNAAVKFGSTVCVFSLEMSKEQLYQRLVSMDAGIDMQRLRTGWIEDDEWERIAESLSRLNEAPIYIDDTPNITSAEIMRKIRALVASGVQVDLVVVDYIQLMRSPAGKRFASREQEVSEISHDLKELARTLHVPVLALAQLSRAVESRQSKIPQLSDLRESGAIEQNADIVMFIYRDDVYNPESERPNVADIIVAKHRNGPVGEVTLFFKKSHTRFANLEVVPSSGDTGYLSVGPDSDSDDQEEGE